MGKRILKFTGRYKRDFKKLSGDHKDLGDLKEIIVKLQNDEPLEDKYLNHKLKGDKQGYWDCHPNCKDIVLIYAKKGNSLYLVRLIPDEELTKIKLPKASTMQDRLDNT